MRRELEVPLAYGTDYALEINGRRLRAWCLWEGCIEQQYATQRQQESSADVMINQAIRDGLKRKLEAHVDRTHYNSRFAPNRDDQRNPSPASDEPPF